MKKTMKMGEKYFRHLIHFKTNYVNTHGDRIEPTIVYNSSPKAKYKQIKVGVPLPDFNELDGVRVYDHNLMQFMSAQIPFDCKRFFIPTA